MKLIFFKNEFKKDMDSISNDIHFKEFLINSFLKSMFFEKGDFKNNHEDYYEYKSRFLDLLKTLKENNCLFDIKFSIDNLNRICLKFNNKNILFISIGPIFGEYFDDEKIVYFSVLFNSENIKSLNINIKNFHFTLSEIKVLYLTD